MSRRGWSNGAIPAGGDPVVRPRLPIGTAGDIACSTADSGTVTARARFRDWDGVTRLVQASGRTRSAGERALKEKLADRAEYRPGNSDLTADSTFKDLADYWLADMEGNPGPRAGHEAAVPLEHDPSRAAGVRVPDAPGDRCRAL